MKKMLFALMFLAAAFKGQSQTLTISNVSPVDVVIEAGAMDDLGGSYSCTPNYMTGSILIPAGGTYVTLSSSWLTTPPAGPFHWFYCRIHDASMFGGSCPTYVASKLCSGPVQGLAIGTTFCTISGLSSSGCMELMPGTCNSAGPGAQVHALWVDNSGNSYIELN